MPVISMFQVNLKGTFNTICLAAEFMRQNEEDEDGCRGVIINTSGLHSENADCGEVAIAAASGAINAMTLPLSREFGEQGIRVVTISPGFFNTPYMKVYENKFVDFIEEDICFPKRLGEPDEYAYLVQAIVKNLYLNGNIICLDGGLKVTN